MRPLRALAIYILVVFIGAALIAPWLYWLAQHFAGSFPGLAHAPFHRFVNRSMYALALLGLWPLFKSLGATSLRDVGLVRPFGQWKKLGVGFGLGFVSLALVAILSVWFGAREFSHNLTTAKIIHRLLTAALTAVVVAGLEEILFRGGIFGGLRRVFDWRLALLVSSMIYALVHFLVPSQDPETVHWASGLQELGLMLNGLTDWARTVPGFLNLTLAGSLLALAYHRTGNLYCSMGLHAGWVFWLKIYMTVTVRVPGAASWLFGPDKMIDGWFPLPVLALTLLLFTRLPLAKSQEPRA
jgi:membrane protease YdiL (CAAX protease family)